MKNCDDDKYVSEKSDDENDGVEKHQSDGSRLLVSFELFSHTFGKFLQVEIIVVESVSPGEVGILGEVSKRKLGQDVSRRVVAYVLQGLHALLTRQRLRKPCKILDGIHCAPLYRYFTTKRLLIEAKRRTLLG